MKEILIFAGTTEGRKLSELLAASRIEHTICVATQYGEIVLKDQKFAKVHQGRMNQEEIKNFIENGNYAAVVDATHPYAEVVTQNIKSAMEGMSIPYFRLQRENNKSEKDEQIIQFETNEDCAKALEKIEGNILLTTGSKELHKYCLSESIKNRLYVRVLPGIESISQCIENGIHGKQIIAMQGPFSKEMNEALIKQYHISCLVTKESGMAGGYQEKIEAAKQTNTMVFVIGRKEEEKGHSFDDVCNALEIICEQKLHKNRQFEIILAGIGMGDKNSLTCEVKEAIENADILLGAERMLVSYQAKIEKKPYYLAKQIIPYLKEIQEQDDLQKTKKVVILFSGDSGFYSGCQSLYHSLKNEIQTGKLNACIQIMPGISSVSYLASCVGESYQDAAICSMHGKNVLNLVRKIKSEQKTFLLTSGLHDIKHIGEILTEAGMNDCEMIVGYQLSYPEQKIISLTPKECSNLKEEGLYTCLIKSPAPVVSKLTHGMKDSKFIRGKVPMTKEEVREVSICKLQLQKDSIVYDIGSGTGSIAIETAALSDRIQVYAIEQKAEAVSLIEQNKQKFALENITVIEKKAPEGLKDLPTATHAFIGGSGGRMKAIFEELYNINPQMRVVANAISMETICELKEILATYKIENEEIVQMQVSRAKEAGKYHLMQAENPVWIFSFNFIE